MRDVNNGWLVRYLHANTASAFFFLVYFHIGRGIYYGSYKAPRTLTWVIGTVIFIALVVTAFLGYVLPYGQMSLWGATVITNLISAVPWIGQDIVESSKIKNCYLGCDIFSSLLPIGIVNSHLFKKDHKRLSEQEYLSIPSSFMAFLAGFIDGDGYIGITKTTKNYIQIKLEISLQLKDISTIEYIHSVLKLGKIHISKDIRNPRCRLIINKSDLQEILFPLFLHHKINFLTQTRVNQYNTAMFILKNNIKFFNEIPDKNIIHTVTELPNSPADYMELYYIKNWIVGFTAAEGSFVIKNNGYPSFRLRLKHNLDTNLFNTFKLIFNTERKIYGGVAAEKNLYNQFSVSSKIDIQKVINFFSYSGLHPLVGLKIIQYFKWLDSLNNNLKYNSLNIPNQSIR